MTDIVQKTVNSNDLYVIDGSNNTLVVDQTNGRVGINNTNPGYSLTVTGATHTTANLSAGTNLFLVDEANSRISIGTTTGVSGFVLNVSGNTTLVGTLKLGSNLTHYNNTAPAAGQLLIGDATAGVWDAATLTAGTNVTITNADGAITIAAAGGGGSPGGNAFNVQINDGGGAFTGDDDFIYDPPNQRLMIGQNSGATSILHAGDFEIGNGGSGTIQSSTIGIGTNPNDNLAFFGGTPAPQAGFVVGDPAALPFSDPVAQQWCIALYDWLGPNGCNLIA